MINDPTLAPRPARIPVPALVCYLPLGDPLVPVEMVDLYADAGVDVLEIGMAAADPALDGAEVRQSMARADRGQARRDLDLLLNRLARRRHAPATLLMSYAEADHPGLDDTAFWAGLDSLLVVEATETPLRARIEATAQAAGLALSAFLPVPVSEAGLQAAKVAEFYVMLQAAAGLTGARAQVDPENAARIAALRQAGVTAPILPGFGISSGAQVRALQAMGADGVVVGSAVLKAALAGPQALSALLNDLKRGLDD